MRLLDDLKYNFKKQDNGLIQLILINVVVFVLMIILFVFSEITQNPTPFYFLYNNFALPGNIHEFLFKPWTLLTYFFTHQVPNFWHIIMNMLGLYWFGKIIHEFLGNRRLINLYILGGLFGGLIFLLLSNTVPFFQQRVAGMGLVGSSGCVFAVAVAAATLAPDYTFFLLFFGPVRIKFIVAFFILVSFVGMVGANSGGDLCHLGGALFGFIYIKQLQRGIDLGKPINKLASWIRGFNKPKMKVTYRKKHDDEISQQEIDAILDKINRTGYTSLTKEEKQKLFKASQK